MNEVLVQAAVLGPAAAGVVWLAAAGRPVVRRVGGGVVALVAHGAAWAVFWTAFRGEPVAWRTLDPGLLGATVAVVAEIGILLAIIRAEALDRPEVPGAVVGLTVACSAVVFGAYAGSLMVQAAVLPIPTLAAAAAALSGRGPRDITGLVGLAAADAVALIGLSLLFADSESAVIGRGLGIGAGALLLLVAGAVKAGAVPGVGTWRLGGSEGAGAPLTAALRAQGVALAAVAGLRLGGAPESIPVAATAAVLVLICGCVGLAARRPGDALASVIGAGAGITFLPLGLGGAVGARAFLLLFPAFLLASGAAMLLSSADTTASPRWRWVGRVALVVAIGSVLGLPPGGGFPGTWLSLSLAVTRGGANPEWLVLVGAATIGLGLAAFSAIGLLRRSGARPVAAMAGAVAAAGLLYIGWQPVRLALGWLVRVEAEVGVPDLLPSAGAPEVPALGGSGLLGAALPALVVVLAVVALGRGVRDAKAAVDAGAPRTTPVLRRDRRRGDGRWSEVRERFRHAGAGLATVLLLEVATLGLAFRLLLLSSRTGFL